MIDNLTLTYDGNQLKNVADAATDPLYNGVFNFVDESKGSGTEYIYDSNGNMQQDYNKKISKIQYNLLNLPAALQFTNGNRKDYTYSADGKKLKVVHKTAIANISVPMGQIKELAANQVSQTHTVDYCGNVIYENGSLSKVLTEEGYVTLSGTTPTFYYHLKDHQGNNRMVVRLNGTSWNTEQVNHYYPFGGVFEVNTETSGKQSYKYNGKELDRMHGLDWYDYGARMMDAALGRFPTPDWLAEKYYEWSPYTYCINNPMRYVDPNGRDVWEIDYEGNIIKRIEDKSQDAFFMVEKGADGNYQRTYTTDEDGNKIYNNISFEYGTVTAVRTPVVNIRNKDGNITTTKLTVFEMKGDDNATRLFEFITNPEVTTNVEWSHAKVGTESSERNIVGTSHQRSSTAVGAYIRETGYTLREVNHNHPSGIGRPSSGDIRGAKLYNERNKNVILNIYTHPQKYFRYNQNGLITP